MAWAVALVTHRARSVVLLRSLREAESRPASSLASILAWMTWSTAIEWSAEAACPAAEKARPANAYVALHGLDRWLALAFHPIAVGRQRCAATDSSRGGRCSYPLSSAPSTDVRATEAEGRMRDEYGARHDFVSSSCTSEKKGNECRRRALWRPGRKHLFSLLRDGSSGRDHSSPSSLTAFVIMRMSSSSALSLALREADDGKRAGSVREPDNTSASEAARERLSSSSLSLTPNKIMSLAATGGGAMIMLGEEDSRMLSLRWWRGTLSLSQRELAWHRLLKSSAPLLFPHRSLGERKGEGARNRVPLWKESYPRAWRGKTETFAMGAVSPTKGWVSVGFPQAWHTLSVSVSRVQGRPGAPRRCICNKAVKFALLVRLFRLTSDSCRGWPSLQAGCCEVLIRLLEAFQRRIPASAKSQRRREFITEEKKSEMRWQAADYKDRRPSHFGRLWRAA